MRGTAGVLALGALAFAVAGAGSGAASPAAHGRAAAHLHVRIHVPLPGDIVVARVVLRGRPGLGVPIRLRLKAVNADKIAPAVVAIGGVVALHRRPLKFVSLIAMVNTHQPGTPPLAKGPFDRYLELDLLDAKGASPADAKVFYSARVHAALDILTNFGQVPEGLRALFQPVDADTETPFQQAIHDRGLDAIPLAGTSERAPASALRAFADPHAVLQDVGDVAESACNEDADHTKEASKKVEGDLATTLVSINSSLTGAKRCDLTKYAFKGLKVSFSLAKTAYSFSTIAGAVCGDPAKTAWDVTYTSTGAGNRTAHPKFSSANPFTLETRRFADGSTVALKLQYSTSGSGPTMAASGSPTGKIGSVVAQPAQAALTSTAVSSC